MKFALLLAATLAASASAPAHASCLSPTAAEKALCAPDAQRFCLQHLANRDAMRACMIEHKKQLSETCKAAFR